MKKENLVFAYAALQGLYWMSYGCIVSFTASFLLDHGFSKGSTGLLIALSSLLSIGLQPVVAGLADRGGRFTVKRVLLFICSVEILPCIFMATMRPPMAIVAITHSGLILLHMSIQPLLSGLGMQLIQNGTPLNFGAARGVGSMSYATLTFFLGGLTVIFTTQCLPAIAAFLLLVILLLLRRFPDNTTASHSERIVQGGTIAVLKKNPNFALLVLGIALMFISHSSINNYMLFILERIGKGNTELGQILAYTALLEVPGMLLFSRLVKRWSCTTLLRFTAIFFVLKVILTALAPNLLLLYLALSTQALSFALFTPASVYYVGIALGREDQIKGQALITIGVTIGNTIGSLCGGYIIQFFGITTLLMIGSVLCGIGMIFFLLGAKEKKEVSHFEPCS